MANQGHKWQKGETGNLSGRPPKFRALTEQLKRIIKKPILDVEGQKHSGNIVLARIIRDLLTTGESKLPNGKFMALAPKDYLDMVRWLYSQIDGPPKQDFDITSGGKSLDVIRIIEVVKPEENGESESS